MYLINLFFAILHFFWRTSNSKQSATDAITTLQEQIRALEAKEKILGVKIGDERLKAKENALSNTVAASAALKRKKMYETELDRLAQTRLRMDIQVHTLESANLNAETMQAMNKAAGVLKNIHNLTTIGRADSIMAEVQEQSDIAREIAEIIAAPAGEENQTEFEQELAELEAEALCAKLNMDEAPIIPTQSQHEDVEPSRSRSMIAENHPQKVLA
ncbi:Snf7-domain-containing protein [Coprinopsis sp. MPI-PUGE-AT-0042]|nr:Snf7-domain-containing protein [Coprinopsis sp. MPI-PUGE-AT-0042]